MNLQAKSRGICLCSFEDGAAGTVAVPGTYFTCCPSLRRKRACLRQGRRQECHLKGFVFLSLSLFLRLSPLCFLIQVFLPLAGRLLTACPACSSSACSYHGTTKRSFVNHSQDCDSVVINWSSQHSPSYNMFDSYDVILALPALAEFSQR